jgi:hypothetical protein
MSVAILITQPDHQPKVTEIPRKQPSQIIPVKVGFMGEQGVGKTTSAGLFAAALSKKFHDGAPVHVTDPELGWQFLNPVIFKPEGITLVQRTVPTFKAMLSDLALAEREGAAVWGVELGKIWIEIIRTLQKAKPDSWGMELRAMWDDFVNRFLNARPHCMVLGRIQDIVEDIEHNGAIRSVKTGEGMKAGGQKNNFGYEPHLVIRMTLEKRPRVKKGKTFEDEGRYIHRAQIAKDRTWALNGKTFRWQDRDGYKPGDFKYVWNDLEPHFLKVQESMGFVTLDRHATSEDLIDDDGKSEYYAARDHRNAVSAEIKAHFDQFFGGRGKDDNQIRLAIADLIFGVKSADARDRLTIAQLERGLRILQGFEKTCAPPQKFPDTSEEVFKRIGECIAEYDRGEAELLDMPF